MVVVHSGVIFEQADGEQLSVPCLGLRFAAPATPSQPLLSLADTAVRPHLLSLCCANINRHVDQLLQAQLDNHLRLPVW